MTSPSHIPEGGGYTGRAKSGQEAVDGARIPGFTLGRLIGEGGMGLVYLATQHKPQRQVAMKLLRPTAVSLRAMRRFERESAILARLEHPGIARLFEAGVAPAQRDTHVHADDANRPGQDAARPTPYFAMELVNGLGLTRYAEHAGLSTRDRLSLFTQVCDTVHYAHEQGVIHRDLKPANILVDDGGAPKVLDFGIARASGSDHTLTTMQTDIGQLLGTLPYMSPEQVVGDPDVADERSDVYALGVTLYELLSGRLPYNVNAGSLPEAARVIRDEEPTPLSSTNRALRGDIETIVGRCLEKEPHRRYPSAKALAQDLQRYLDNRPIVARPPSGWYQATRFAKRNKVLVAGLAAVFATLVLGMAGTSMGRSQAIEAQRREAIQRAEAELQRREALAAADRAEASERASLRALEEERRMRAMAEEQRLKSSIVDVMYRSIIGEFDTDVASEEQTTQLSNMLAAGDLAASNMQGLHPAAEAELRLSLGRGYLYLGQFDQAYAQCEQAYNTACVSSGPASLAAIYAQGGLAMAHGDEITIGEAVAILERQRAIARRVEGFETPSHALIVSSLGMTYYADEHIGHMVQVLGDMYPAILAGRLLDNKEIAKYEKVWAVGLLELARYEEAVGVLDSLLVRQEQLLGHNHGETLSTAYNLAWAYLGVSRAAEAAELLEETLPLAKELYARNPRRYLPMRRMLGRAYYLSGQTDNALAIYQVLYDEAVEAFGEDHPEALIENHRLAQALMQDQQYEASRDRFEFLLVQNEQRLGTYHIHTITTLSSLARCYLACEDPARAREMYNESVSRYAQAFGPNHIATLRERRMVVICAGEAGRHDEALTLANHLLNDAVQALGDDHEITAKVAVTMGRCEMAAGQPRRARDTVLAWIDRLADNDWADAFFRYRAYECLAEACQALGEPEGAQRWRDAASELHAQWDFPID